MIEKLKDSNIKPGVFNRADYPKAYQNENFYFKEYCKPDGELIKKGETICNIKIGKELGSCHKGAAIIAQEEGILECTLRKDNLINSGYCIYKLHPKGIYQHENKIENDEYKHYFFLDKNKKSFDSWLVSDGSFVNKADNIYKYTDSNFNKFIHKAEKDGYIHIVDPEKIYTIKKNELIYYIRNRDNKRISEKYKNIPSVIIDDFTKNKIITWDRVSSNSKTAYGIISKSDDGLVDLTFTFNYFLDSDKIVFHFNPKQIKPKQNDKISFLFINGSVVEFSLNSNPVSIKNKNGKRVLEYKSTIIKTELEIFSNEAFKRWKIELHNEHREILGGNRGGLIDYNSKNNLQIVIKKFVVDYTSTVIKNISEYKPIETRKISTNKIIKNYICHVYLMHDTANGYHKIGISNKPEYRERTLQSEKPSIELITSKEFPIRTIAENIEKALHNVYSDKRLRGEWFKLKDKDVKDIIETLK